MQARAGPASAVSWLDPSRLRPGEGASRPLGGLTERRRASPGFEAVRGRAARRAGRCSRWKLAADRGGGGGSAEAAG